MFIDIAEIPAEGLDIEFREAEDFLDPSGMRICLLRPVEANLHFCRTSTEVWVRGQVSSHLRLYCSRCSEPFTFPVCEGFEVRYRGPLGEIVEGEHELGPDELEVKFLDEARINVSGFVRENVLLALPVQPLCDEGCRGLCPRCGINLNEGTCRCSPTSPDPRWRDLEALL
ncbi:MAG: DUF177 domain-containing protein [Candidatus Methylomirabilales bacterium]